MLVNLSEDGDHRMSRWLLYGGETDSKAMRRALPMATWLEVRHVPNWPPTAVTWAAPSAPSPRAVRHACRVQSSHVLPHQGRPPHPRHGRLGPARPWRCECSQRCPSCSVFLCLQTISVALLRMHSDPGAVPLVSALSACVARRIACLHAC